MCFSRNGGGSIPVELVFLAPAVSSGSSTLCDPISALALALRLLSSEPHRVRRWRSKPFPSERFLPTLARWGRVSWLTLKAYRSPEIPLPRINGSPRVADFGSQGTAGSPILLPPPKEHALSRHINRPGTTKIGSDRRVSTPARQSGVRRTNMNCASRQVQCHDAVCGRDRSS